MTQYKALPTAISAMVLAVLSACASQRPMPAPAQATGSAPVESSSAAEDLGAPIASYTDTQGLSGSELLRQNAPLRYVVKRGDTLWDIANKYLADPYHWPEVWYVNGKIANPHRIYPGDVLELHNVRGKLKIARNGALERVSPQIRFNPLDSAIPAIPLDVIRHFLNGPRLVDAETLDKAPYLLAFMDEHIMGGANMGVYLKNISAQDPTTFQMVRRGDVYKDPDTGDLLGYEAVPVGVMDLRNRDRVSEGMITSSSREVLLGDRLLPMEAEKFEAAFYPHPPKSNVNARVISTFDALNSVAQYQIVTLNRGSNHGLETGHVLTLFKPERRVEDPITRKGDVVPELRAGQLIVFKVMPRLSYGLVMIASRPITVMDKAEKPAPQYGK